VSEQRVDRPAADATVDDTRSLAGSSFVEDVRSVAGSSFVDVDSDFDVRSMSEYCCDSDTRSLSQFDFDVLSSADLDDDCLSESGSICAPSAAGPASGPVCARAHAHQSCAS